MILVTIEESDKQIISGIPEYITVETSSPSTVFYTLDGTDPDSESGVYIDKIYLAYNTPKSTIKLYALGTNDSSDIITMEWNVAIPDYNRVLQGDAVGLNILDPDEEVVDSMAFDYEGNDQRNTVISFDELDIKANTSDRIGQEIPDGSTISFVKFPTVLRKTLQEVSSTNDADFNPQAKLIIIDGYAGFADQDIRVINRPHGTMSPNSKAYKDYYHYNSQPSGDFITYKYNPKTKKIVLYYREYLDNRWIISTQRVDAKGFNLEPTSQNRFVFRWLIDRAQTKLY